MLGRNKTKVYLATKLSHAQKVIDFCNGASEMEWTQTWPEVVGLIDDSPDNAKVFWQRDLKDVDRSDYVIVYAEAKDHLRGALVEAGYALACRKPVIVVCPDIANGHHPDFGTWAWHPLVYRAHSLAHALWLIRYHP